MCILSTHSSENGRFGRSPKPSNPKPRTFLRLLRGLRIVSKLCCSSSRLSDFQNSHSFEVRDTVFGSLPFSNSEGLESLKEYALSEREGMLCWFTFRLVLVKFLFRFQKA